MTVGVRADDHIAIVVAVQIRDLAQQGDGIVAGLEAFGKSDICPSSHLKCSPTLEDLRQGGTASANKLYWSGK